MGRVVQRGQVDLDDDSRPQEQVVQINETLSVCINAPIVCNRQTFEKKVKAGLRHAVEARKRGLMPTPYFFEALDYVRKAKKLQDYSLQRRKVPKVGDPLMEAIPIYNTVQRRYAGFSNVLEQLWYGSMAPKIVANQKRGFITSQRAWQGRIKHHLDAWLYITLAHRITGSGASFEWDHGWRNNRISEMALVGAGNVYTMANWLADYDGPIFTSIGNQIPPFPKCGGREYLRTIAPELVKLTAVWLREHLRITGKPAPIKTAVDAILALHTSLDCKRFKFVLTAWVMDMAEYLPKLVDPRSDCYHGKNAIEAMELCFDSATGMKKQVFYDTATRLFADLSGTYPMDVEDASPGCDLVRWIENYVPKKGFDHVIEQGIFNGSSLTWHDGRQPPPF